MEDLLKGSIARWRKLLRFLQLLTNPNLPVSNLNTVRYFVYSLDDDDDIIVLNVDDAAAENRPPECSNDNCSRSEKDANGSEIIPSNQGSGKNVSKKKQMSIESSSQSRSQQSSPFFAIVSRSRSRSDGL